MAACRGGDGWESLRCCLLPLLPKRLFAAALWVRGAGVHFQKPFGKGAEGFVSDGVSGCFAPGTSHNTGRARLGREQHSTEEQRLSKDGTWALQGDSGFEQENPEAFTISRSWDQPLVVAG